MESITEINDKEKVAIEIKKRLKNEKITKEQFLRVYGKELQDGELECMLKGIYPYNDRMNNVATDFLGIKVSCKPKIDNVTYSFRRGKGNGNRDEFIEHINIRFNILMEKSKKNLNELYKFNKIKEFEQVFKIAHPTSIENFIKENQNKDNFLVIKSKNNIGISGMSTIIHKNDISYKCIYINTVEPMGRQIFTFFHELYHIYFEKSEMHILDSYEYSDTGCEIENKAHKFSSELIMNSVKLIALLRKMNMSNHRNIEYKDVFYIQKRFNATFQAVIFKIEQLEKAIINSKIRDEIERKRALQNIPNIPTSFKRYYNEKYWEELNNKIKIEDPENVLNFPTDEEVEYI